MKAAICETRLGWVAMGIEDGAICAATLPTTRTRALETIAGWQTEEQADDAEAAPFIDLVQRAAEGEDVHVNGHVRFARGTAFQRAVWQALLDIPRGATMTYAEVAARVGRPGAARAVGQAVGHNPVPLLIPCHRVVGSNGGLGGFGGGLPMKRTLLHQEGVAV